MTDPLAALPSDIRRIAFLGTPDASVPALRALIEADFHVPLVVSRPDRRRGRGSTLIPSPVKAAALELGLTVTDDLDELMTADIDAAIVVAYGRIIRLEMLQRIPMVNIHFSLLPRWRGAAPVERAILAGDTKTGVCLMEVAEDLDEGGIYASETTGIGQNESAAELRDRLAIIGADLLVRSLHAGLGHATPQNGEITYAAKLDKSEARLDFAKPALDIHRTVRVGRAWCEFRGGRLGIEQALLADDNQPAGDPAAPPVDPPGSIYGSLVTTGDGMLELLSVKPEGKRAMSARDWLNGVRPEPHELLT